MKKAKKVLLFLVKKVPGDPLEDQVNQEKMEEKAKKGTKEILECLENPVNVLLEEREQLGRLDLVVRGVMTVSGVVME